MVLTTNMSPCSLFVKTESQFRCNQLYMLSAVAEHPASAVCFPLSGSFDKTTHLCVCKQC